jgi:hypothetical protein
MKERTRIRPFFKRYNDIYLEKTLQGGKKHLKFEAFISQIQMALLELVSL